MSESAFDREKVILIDGNGLAYRAFYALPPLKTSQGEPVNAVYGFTNMLFKIIEREKPDYIAVAFDKSRPTRRLEEFDQYKAHRQKMPDELLRQMPIIEEVVKVLNIPVFHMEGYEADDCIATLTVESEKRGHTVKIYSGDLDMLQLVSELTQVVTTRRGISDLVVYDHDLVRKRYGINPPQLVDYKALAGDSSDHIPGIPGIGEASASKLLNQFTGIEDMYEESSRIPSRWRKQILENRDRAFLSKKLASLEKTMELGIDWDFMRYSEFNREALKRLFIRLEFKTMLTKLGFKDEELEEIQEIVVQIVGKDEDIDNMLDELKEAGSFGMVWIAGDEGELVGLAMAQGTNNGYYFPFALPEQLNIASTFGISIFSRDRIIHELKPLMDNPEITKYVYDLKTGIHFLKRSEYFTGVGFVDMSAAAFLLEPDNPPKSLETVLSRYTDFVPKTLEEIATPQPGRKKVKIMEVPLQDLTLFLAGRAVRLNNMGPLMKSKLQDAGLWDICTGLESSLSTLLSAMEDRGVNIDKEALSEESKSLTARMDAEALEIFRLSGRPFNINSTKQLGKVLFEELNIQGAKKTATGYRTDAEILQKLSDQHPVIDKILKYREISRLKSAFADAVLQQIDPASGRMKLSYNQNGSAMGALSTGTPNLAGLPMELRRVFIPTDQDKVFLKFEYPRLHLQLLTYLSRQDNLMEALREKKDPAEYISSVLSGEEEVSPEKTVEVINGMIFGSSGGGSTAKAEISKKDAKILTELLLEKFPKIKEFIERNLDECRETGYVRSILGRTRPLAGISGQNRALSLAAEKLALQFKIQAGANDIIKKTMVDILEKVLRGHRDIHLLIQTGNEFLFETRRRRADKYSAQILEIMESAFDAESPLHVRVMEGDNWLEMKLKNLK